MKLEGLDKETVKLGVAVIGAGLIGGLCWKYRKRIKNGLDDFFRAPGPYIKTEEEDEVYCGRLIGHSWVKGHWRLNHSGKVTYVKPHYRVSWRRRY